MVLNLKLISVIYATLALNVQSFNPKEWPADVTPHVMEHIQKPVPSAGLKTGLKDFLKESHTFNPKLTYKRGKQVRQMDYYWANWKHKYMVQLFAKGDVLHTINWSVIGGIEKLSAKQEILPIDEIIRITVGKKAAEWFKVELHKRYSATEKSAEAIYKEGDSSIKLVYSIHLPFG
ncbi:hypothetical protein [Pedobacter sp. FW305-3-2-15-E-R2A2]|uniref:hypothetical protein n=1 Tax=Pedobacter sp. FW305-3-2-15-E-R2A2 TaxID=3140251 RepID=UPI0031407BF7